jgi:hypothetical protein
MDEVSSDQTISIELEVMINMFKIIDNRFINLWNRVPNTHASAAWITQVQVQLLEAVPAYFECTEVQEVQIRITQQWLRSQAWQLSNDQILVSSVSDHVIFKFQHLIEIARDLLTIVPQYLEQAKLVHEVELVSSFLFFGMSPLILEIVCARALHLSLEQSLNYFSRTSATLCNVCL